VYRKCKGEGREANFNFADRSGYCVQLTDCSTMTNEGCSYLSMNWAATPQQTAGSKPLT
jgi:hypothetical protein